LGVDGLRLDAAKHIPTADIANILSRLTIKPYITQEVIFGSGEPITPAMYTGNGELLIVLPDNIRTDEKMASR
jgi:glycosidase